MYSHPSAPGLDATSDTAEPVIVIPAVADSTCASQTDSAGLCDAVSLSLGLGASAAASARSALSFGAVQEPGLGDLVKMSDALSHETNFKGNDSGFLTVECADVDEVGPSCLDMLHSSKRDSLFPYQPLYYKKTTNPSRSEGAYGSSAEPEPAGFSGPWYCKYCNYTHGSFWRPCPYANAYTPLAEADGPGIAEMRAAAQVESYRSGMQRSVFVNAPVKTEPIWEEAIDTSCDSLFPELRAFSAHRRVCQVCGDNASGCHYGAITCGSCKVFFKRAAEGKQNHLCASRNDCTIDKLRRKNCPSCRLRRCFLCGMSLRGRRLKGSGQSSSEQEWGTHGRDGPSPGERQRDGEWVAVSQPYAAAPSPSIPSNLSLLSVLQAIEPPVVNAGHDPNQPDCPASLLTSLNELGERQLVSVVRWAKAMPGFRDLDVQDQLSVIQSSWLGVMVLGLGWRSYTHTDASLLYFAPDLVFNDERMQVSSMYDHCARMRLLSQRFFALQVTQEEFLCMKAVLLFSILPVEGLRSQRCFDNMRRAYINELDRLASQRGEATRMQRLFQLTQLLDFLQPIVRKLHQFTYDLFIQAKTLPIDVTYPDMIAEIVSRHVPKILTGMVQPILFHQTP